MKETPSVTGCLFAMVWFPLLIVASAMYHGFVLTKLWAWFVVPTFALPLLSLPAAIGLSLIVGFMAKDNTTTSDGEDSSFGEVVVKATVKAALVPSFSLLTGWIVSGWMK